MAFGVILSNIQQPIPGRPVLPGCQDQGWSSFESFDQAGNHSTDGRKVRDGFDKSYGVLRVSLAESVKEKREEILKVAALRGAKNVRLFGSLVRGEERTGSDVDLLVDMEKGRSLMDLSHLIQDMEELLGCPVHIVEPEALHWAIRERILEEAVPL